MRGLKERIMRKYSNSIFEAAKLLRDNPTKAETFLWEKLKSKQLNGIKFRFQVPYDSFILDFLCPSYKLIIEVDGESHKFSKERDQERDDYFKAKGYEILRVKNEEVLENTDNVLEKIKIILGITTPKSPI